MSTLAAAVPRQHPNWCDRDHSDRPLVHAVFVGEIACGPSHTLTVNVVDGGLDEGPQIRLEVADSRNDSRDAYPLTAQAAHDLAMLLAASSDVVAGRIGWPLEQGMQR
ncbi:hypothetical protein ACFQO7_28180 [Catellatospora aurea]|uniref:Uncharacterized protein n=1 Tax=Catellatospora aurea TaxID=1337874 RepID=A0ABW2H7S3_9ACTN